MKLGDYVQVIDSDSYYFAYIGLVKGFSFLFDQVKIDFEGESVHFNRGQLKVI